jgi:hypothetical protein
VIKQRLASVSKDDNADDTFLSVWLGNRIRIVEIPLDSTECEESFEKEVIEGNSKYELVSTKEYKDGDVNGFQFASPKCLRMVCIYS